MKSPREWMDALIAAKCPHGYGEKLGCLICFERKTCAAIQADALQAALAIADRHDREERKSDGSAWDDTAAAIRDLIRALIDDTKGGG